VNDKVASDEPKLRERGDFFHIDRRTWAVLCDLDDVKMAVAYLVIAQGTWKGGRFSAWSAKSIEKHTGLHSIRAKEAIGRLVANGFLRLTQESTRRSPRYEVLAFHEVEPKVREQKRASLSDWHRFHFDELVAAGDDGKKPAKRNSSFDALNDLVGKGLAGRNGDRFFCTPPVDPSAQLIWLPNEIVQGTDVGEPEPVRLLRARNDIWALRLFIDLYQAHNLSADGGISRGVLIGKYNRKRLGQRGRHLIWGFSRNGSSAWFTDGITRCHETRPRNGDGNHPIWDSIAVLTSLGLLYSVPHVIENEDSSCEIIHAFGTNANAEPMELELGKAAQEAGEYMLGEELTTTYESHGIEHLAPIFDSYPNVQLAGVYRLRYRPKTSMTADWMRRLWNDHREWVPVYRRLADRNENAVAPALQTA